MFAYSAESTFERIDGAHAGCTGSAGRRRSCAPDEAHELGAQVAAQQARAAGHRRVGGVDERVPVDLVETDRRPAAEARVATRWMRSTIICAVSSGQVDRAPRLPRVHEPVDDPGVEHEVLPDGARSIELPQPGTWNCEPGGTSVGRWSMKTGALTRARAIRRARWSLRAGPRWPSCAATLCVSSSPALTSASTPPLPGTVDAALVVPGAVQPLRHPVGVFEIARVVVRERGVGELAAYASSGSAHRSARSGACM